jgi:hypothetical protein
MAAKKRVSKPRAKKGAVPARTPVPTSTLLLNQLTIIQQLAGHKIEMYVSDAVYEGYDDDDRKVMRVSFYEFSGIFDALSDIGNSWAEYLSIGDGNESLIEDLKLWALLVSKVTFNDSTGQKIGLKIASDMMKLVKGFESSSLSKDPNMLESWTKTAHFVDYINAILEIAAMGNLDMEASRHESVMFARRKGRLPSSLPSLYVDPRQLRLPGHAGTSKFSYCRPHRQYC